MFGTRVDGCRRVRTGLGALFSRCVVCVLDFEGWGFVDACLLVVSVQDCFDSLLELVEQLALHLYMNQT